ncbi:uncharacterized protein K441DRAFT_215888 [Cenococcum geophilum 1.58]|uniref:uncharacterized protein n=1 Tax=Cenococcum geophilum 1.58 TaxID=794803 RepID=UPI00358F28C1|nr:hypothetical protein K441DRAFT_215888 [Cenococcum geophilum 1.58]
MALVGRGGRGFRAFHTRWVVVLLSRRPSSFGVGDRLEDGRLTELSGVISSEGVDWTSKTRHGVLDGCRFALVEGGPVTLSSATCFNIGCSLVNRLGCDRRTKRSATAWVRCASLEELDPRRGITDGGRGIVSVDEDADAIAEVGLELSFDAGLELGLELGLGVGVGVTLSGVTVSLQVLNNFPSETLHDLESDSLHALNDLPSDAFEE